MDTLKDGDQNDIAFRILSALDLDANQIDQLVGEQETVLAVLSIHESLMCIFENDFDRAIEWQSRPNAAFGGLSALEVILSGDSERVRTYLKYHVYNA